MRHCEFAYRKAGDVSLHCKRLLEMDRTPDYCGHQYLCNQTRRWEVTPQGRDCPLRKKEADSSGQ